MDSKSEKLPIVRNLPTLSPKKKPSFINFQPQLCSLFSLQKKYRTKINTSNVFPKKMASVVSSPSFVQWPCHTNIVDPGALHRAFFSLPQHPIRRSHRHCLPGLVRSWNRWDHSPVDGIHGYLMTLSMFYSFIP